MNYEEWLKAQVCSCGHGADEHSEGDGCSCCSSNQSECGHNDVEWKQQMAPGDWKKYDAGKCRCTNAKSLVLFKAVTRA